MRKTKLLIVLFIGLAALSAIVSCTYDYFEDETNYIVVVPEVLDNSIEDCRVMIYDAAGTLVKERYAARPWDENQRIMRGEFTFRLPAGEYKVYCYTNTGGVTFIENENLETSAFTLNGSADATTYVPPSEMFFQTLNRSIVHPGIMHKDTTAIERYVGRIVVRFKNPPMTPAEISNIANVRLQADGAAAMQYLKKDTLTDHRSANDVMASTDGLLTPATPALVEVEHLYFPTVDDGGVVQLAYTFLDPSNGEILTIPVSLADETDPPTPIRLLHGRKLIVEVDKYTVIKTTLVGWDEDIHSGDTNLE